MRTVDDPMQCIDCKKITNEGALVYLCEYCGNSMEDKATCCGESHAKEEFLCEECLECL